MTRIESLLAELAHETATARKHLERLPDPQFGWRPHVKSFTAGELASRATNVPLDVEKRASAPTYP